MAPLETQHQPGDSNMNTFTYATILITLAAIAIIVDMVKNRRA